MGSLEKKMFDLEPIEKTSKKEFYSELNKHLLNLLGDENDSIANMANFTSLLFYAMKDINWVGFYQNKANELVLGPFQGKPACIRIPFGKGVCGTSAQKRETLVVKNVREFPGHIACDSASNSEIVIPVVKNNQLFAVLDIDSPNLERFDSDDQSGIELLVNTFIQKTELT